MQIFFIDIKKAEGVDIKNVNADDIREQAYFEMDMPFRMWLQKIDPETDDMEDTLSFWLEQAKRIVINLADKALSEVGEKALVGRYIKENNTERLIAAPIAYSRFISAIRKAERG